MIRQQVSEVRIFLFHNNQQFKLAFAVSSLTMITVVGILLILGDNKYSVFDKIILPLALGILAGVLVALLVIFIGYMNWLGRRRFFDKYFTDLIEAHGFQVNPYFKSAWELTMPALRGSINGQKMYIEMIEQKDVFISMIDDYDWRSKEGIIFRYKTLKKSGTATLIAELNAATL